MTKQWKVSFPVSEENYKRGKNIKRSINVSEKLREAYEKILQDDGV